MVLKPITQDSGCNLSKFKKFLQTTENWCLRRKNNFDDYLDEFFLLHYLKKDIEIQRKLGRRLKVEDSPCTIVVVSVGYYVR